MSCAVCLRDGRGFGFADPTKAFGAVKRRQACSIFCLEILHHYWRVGDVLKPTQYEQQALEKASDEAGAYLESIGKTDLAALSQDEWRAFLGTVFETSANEIARLTDEDSVPF